MLMSTVRRGALLFVLLVSGLSLSPAGAVVERPQPRNGLPRLMLWAWERPTDLRALDAGIGVAFLAQTLVVRDGAVAVVPRRNPLRVSAHTPLAAVTRVESGDAGAAALGAAAAGTMAAAIAATMSLPGVRGVQIDFDAAESERAFYRALVRQVRRTVGPGVPLSITALASWCAQDRWMSGLPVDEAVPMLFRMGPVHSPYVGLARSPAAAADECRSALGTSLDEPLHVRAGGRRVYVFNASSWTAASLTQAREMLE
jgi:hypothetical protein